MAWIFLMLAGLFEIGFTTCLKLSSNFTKIWPSLGFIASAILSFWFLTKSLQQIELGTSYAVWTGIGAFGTALIGIFCFHESASAPRLIFLSLLIISIIGLKLVSLSNH